MGELCRSKMYIFYLFVVKVSIFCILLQLFQSLQHFFMFYKCKNNQEVIIFAFRLQNYVYFPNQIFDEKILFFYSMHNFVGVHASGAGVEDVLVESALTVNLVGGAALHHASRLQHVEVVGVDNLADVV